MAVGCSAETGAPGDEAQIGSTAEALSASEIASGPALPAGLAYHSSAVVTVSGEQYLMIIGGWDATTPTYSDDVRVLRLSTSTWYTINAVLPAGAAFGQAMVKPGDASKALYFGGQTGATSYSSAVTELTLTVDASNIPTGITTASSGTLTVARSNFKIAPCGTDKVIIVGGKTSTATPQPTLDVWSAGSVATLKDSGGTQALTLTDARFDLALAEKDSTHIAVFGGMGSLGPISSIETMVLDSNCKLTTAPASHKTTKLALTLTAARSRLEAYFDQNVATNQDKFAVVAGNDGAVSDDDDRVTIDWVTPASSSKPAVASISVAADRPTLYVGGAGHAYLFGGIANNNMQEDSPGWSSTTQDNATPANTLAQRDGATANLVTIGGASRILVVGGFDNANTALLTSTLKITP
jgi:hypothetical protein